MANIREQKLLYHLTEIGNLPSIFELGLLPRSQVTGFVDVANQEIISSREKFDLQHFVPFHFFANNPFDGAVQIANPSKSFVFLTVTRAHAQAQNWKIVPRHPLAAEAITLLDYRLGIDAIDWGVMNTRNYRDANCKSVCMAECLSPSGVPVERISRIFVKDSEANSFVIEHLKKIGLSVAITQNPSMFAS